MIRKKILLRHAGFDFYINVPTDTEITTKRNEEKDLKLLGQVEKEFCSKEILPFLQQKNKINNVLNVVPIIPIDNIYSYINEDGKEIWLGRIKITFLESSEETNEKDEDEDEEKEKKQKNDNNKNNKNNKNENENGGGVKKKKIHHFYMDPGQSFLHLIKKYEERINQNIRKEDLFILENGKKIFKDTDISLYNLNLHEYPFIIISKSKSLHIFIHIMEQHKQHKNTTTISVENEKENSNQS